MTKNTQKDGESEAALAARVTRTAVRGIKRQGESESERTETKEERREHTDIRHDSLLDSYYSKLRRRGRCLICADTHVHKK